VYIESYSPNSINPRRAKIVIIEEDDDIVQPATITKFHLLGKFGDELKIDIDNYEKKMDEMIISNSKIPEMDKLSLLISDVIFNVYRSGFSIDGVYLTTQYNNLNSYRFIFFPVQMGNHVITITNADIQYEGVLFYSSFYVNLDIENVTIDMHTSRGGFFL